MKENFEEEQRMMEEMQKAKYGDLDMDDNLEFLQNAMKGIQGSNKVGGKSRPRPKIGKKFKEDEDEDEDINLMAQQFSNPHNPYEGLRARYQNENDVIEEQDEVDSGDMDEVE